MTSSMRNHLRKAMQDPQRHRACQGFDPLFKAQLAILQCLERVIYHRAATTAVVRLPRQLGKNEINAMLLIRFLLYCCQQKKTIITTGLTGTQALVTKKRLSYFAIEDLFLPFTKKNLKWKNGQVLEYGKAEIVLMSTFNSGGTKVEGQTTSVGETADTLLWIDEAPLVELDVIDSTFLPMRAFKRAPVVFAGIGGTGKNAINRAVTQYLGRPPDKFEVIFDIKKAIFFTTGAFWREQLGEDHPWTQACLEARDLLGKNNPHYLINWECQDVSSINAFFSREQVTSILDSDFERKMRRGMGYNGLIVAILDNAGGDNEIDDDTHHSGNDPAALLIFEVFTNDKKYGFPKVHLIDALILRGKKQTAQLPKYLDMFQKHRPDLILSDARGNGLMMTQYIAEKHPQVVAHTSTEIKNDADCTRLYAMVEHGQLKVFRNDDSDQYREIVRQLEGTALKVKRHSCGILQAMAKGSGLKKDIMISCGYMTELLNQYGYLGDFGTAIA